MYNIKRKINNNKFLNKKDVLFLLQKLFTDEKNEIYKIADNIRKKNLGDEIFVRGIIEFSNHCFKKCYYCGISCLNKKAIRYRIKENEIIEICKKIEKFNQSTVVLQSGEDKYYTKEKIGNLIKKIKKETQLAITLSVGERNLETYKYWKDCGMDRYLIRFETSNAEIYKKIHYESEYKTRLECIENLKKIGVQTGSGFMIGIPETTLEDIAEDIIFCRNLDLDMIGVGPFIPHHDTKMGCYEIDYDIDFFSGVISILRIVCPEAHIPATTAMDTIDKNGRQLVLQRGGNIFMPNSTPKKYRDKYLLYPNKPCVDETPNDCSQCVKNRIFSIGRKIGIGHGHSIKHKRISK